MRWSLPIGRISGIALRLHATFLILLGWIGVDAFLSGGLIAAKWELLRVGLIFGCIGLHELGHSLVAQQLGVAVTSITLLPIGGVAALRRIPENPWHEIAITLAGPMVNAAIAAVLLPWVGWHGLNHLFDAQLGWAGIARALLGANLVLFLFNLIPAFPMDGGRLLRAVLALLLSYRRATSIAAGVGQVLAVGFAIVGVLASAWLLVLVGVFIFVGAEGEAKLVRQRSALAGHPVAELMSRPVAVLAPSDTVEQGIRALYQTGQDDFPVTVEGQLVGWVVRVDLLDAALKTPVGEVMATHFPAVTPADPVAQVYEDFLSTGTNSVPVVVDGQVVGLLTGENIRRFLEVQAGFKKRRRATVAGRTPAPPPVTSAAPPVAPPPLPGGSVPPAGPA